MTTPKPTPANLRASLVAIGTADIEAQRDASLDELVSSFAHTQVLLDKGDISVKVAAILVAFLNQLNDDETRGDALRRLAAGADVATIDDQSALQHLMNSNRLNIGQKHLLERALVPDHKDAIRVDSKGTPTELAELQKENDRLQALTDGSHDTPSAKDLKKAQTEALAPVKTALPALQQIAADWATVGSRNPLAKAKEQSEDDTVRREVTRKDLKAFQDAVGKIEQSIKDTSPATA